MKLKDKKIDIQGVQYVTDKYGNHKKKTVTIATVWAYFRQLSGNEIYRVTTQTTEEVMFVINYRTDITTENVILYKGVKYNIVRVDVFEGYKSDLTLYCKRQA
jgi:SPP1 family predicted phage head-tail adaptor